MKRTGNGSAAVCAGNLLQIVRGESFYERLKGIDPRLMDQPITSVEAQLQQDAEWMLETYEPRITVQGTHINPDVTAGGYTITVDTKEQE